MIRPYVMLFVGSIIFLGTLMSCSHKESAKKNAHRAEIAIAKMEAIDHALSAYEIYLLNVNRDTEIKISKSVNIEVLEQLIRPKLEQFIKLGDEVKAINRSEGVVILRGTLDAIEGGMLRARRYLSKLPEKMVVN